MNSVKGFINREGKKGTQRVLDTTVGVTDCILLS
jgi:hypothetical protein